MGAWYWIGLFAGLGVALGVLFVGLLGSFPRGSAAALALAVAAVAAAAFAFEDWTEALAGALGAALGAYGAARLVQGALRRGGTRGGTAVLVGVAALVLAGIAIVPALGYVEALALPLLAARLRARADSRYEGLRVLAKD